MRFEKREEKLELQPSVSFQFCDVGKVAMVHKMILPHFAINDNESKKIEESFVYCWLIYWNSI
jgi:hypothetical protein